MAVDNTLKWITLIFHYKDGMISQRKIKVDQPESIESVEIKQ